MTTDTTGRIRARTQQQKSDRRKGILEAAEGQFRKSGFEGFSMGVLARDAGVAKGTLYLYFKTREEVLLALYNTQLVCWCAALSGSITADMSDQAFAGLFFKTMRRDPVFLQLLARLDSVIEHNVSFEALVESKKLMIAQLQQVSPKLQECLGLSAAAVFDLVSGFAALMLGAQQSDSGPSLDADKLPADVVALVESFAAEKLFVTNACRILRGIRSDYGAGEPAPSKALRTSRSSSQGSKP